MVKIVSLGLLDYIMAEEWFEVDCDNDLTNKDVQLYRKSDNTEFEEKDNFWINN